MRLFIGVPVPKKHAVRLEEMLAHLGDNTLASIRRVPRENYHLTLCFLGNAITDDKVYVIKECLSQRFSYGFSAFDVDMIRMGGFPNKEGPHLVAWLDNTLLLQSLVDELHRALNPLGVQKPRHRFMPHITLGHFRKPIDARFEAPSFPDSSILGSEWSLPIDQLQLFQSMDTRQGVRYHCLARQPLEHF